MRLEYPDADIVHRLDMPTSGIIIFALTSDTQRALSMLFEKKDIHKQYIARVFGELDSHKGVINLPLIADWPNRPRQKIDLDGRNRDLVMVINCINNINKLIVL